jgi:hypothetical protein
MSTIQCLKVEKVVEVQMDKWQLRVANKIKTLSGHEDTYFPVFVDFLLSQCFASPATTLSLFVKFEHYLIAEDVTDGMMATQILRDRVKRAARTKL